MGEVNKKEAEIKSLNRLSASDKVLKIAKGTDYEA